MKAKILLLFMVLIAVFSCGPGLDEEGSTSSLYIKNTTNTDIKVVYIAQKIFNNTDSIVIKSGGETFLFMLLSGMGYRYAADPSLYDSAYVYYADKILIDSIRGKGLLERSNFITDPTETYTKKYETYYKEVFTIDSAYINSHFK